MKTQDPEAYMIRFHKPLLVFVVALVATSPTAATEPPPWSLDLLLSTTTSAGVMGEYVYAGSRTLSYLDWQLMPLVTLDVGMEGSAPWGTQLGARVTLPLTRITGTMTNSDYEDPNSPLTRTKISHHTAIVDTYRDLDVWLLQRIAVDNSGSTSIGVGYRDRFVKMIAQDGEYDYGDSAGPVNGVVITYEQHQRIPYLVFAAASAGREQLGASAFFSPYVHVDALDHHHRRLLDFHDTIRRAFWFQIQIDVAFELAGQAVQLAGFAELIPATRGDTYTVDYTTDSFVGTTSSTFTNGAGVSWWQAGVRVSLPFGW